jgi:hypothetical protein
MNYFFFLPFYYLIHSRLKNKFELFSWQIIFFIPILIFTYYYLEIKSNIFIHLFLISQVIFYSIYEIGYIENDIITVKKEKNPTIRLNKKNTKFISKNYSILIYSRYLIFLLLVSLLFWIDKYIEYILNIELFLFQIIITRIIFFFHNQIRNRLTIFTFFFLSVSKYTFPFILFIEINENFYVNFFFLILLFPLLRSIEILCLKRYNLNFIINIIKNIDKLRVVYYFVLSTLIISIFLLKILNYDDFFITHTLALYFLIFRIICYYVIKKNLYIRNKGIRDKFNKRFSNK